MAEHDLRSAEARMVAEARKAFFVIFGLLCLVWTVQLGNWADRNGLALQYGIRPHDLTRLPEVFTAPLLHFSWQHLEGNSGPLFVFGFLAAYRGVKKFLLLTLLITLTSGLAVWILQAGNTVSVGASGLIFGYLGYVVLRGIFDRHLIDTLIGVVMAASFAYELAGAVPGAPGGVSWLAHLGGLLGGAAGAWLLRDRAGQQERAGGADRPAPRGESARSGSGGSGGSGADSRADLLKELKDLGL